VGNEISEARSLPVDNAPLLTFLKFLKYPEQPPCILLRSPSPAAPPPSPLPVPSSEICGHAAQAAVCSIFLCVRCEFISQIKAACSFSFYFVYTGINYLFKCLFPPRIFLPEAGPLISWFHVPVGSWRDAASLHGSSRVDRTHSARVHACMRARTPARARARVTRRARACIPMQIAHSAASSSHLVSSLSISSPLPFPFLSFLLLLLLLLLLLSSALFSSFPWHCAFSTDKAWIGSVLSRLGIVISVLKR